MKWLELSVEADVEAIDSVAELFSRYGHGGVAIEQPLAESADPLSSALDATKPATLRTYLPIDEKTPGLRREIERELGYLGLLRPIGTLQTRELSEEDWSQSWKEHFHVHHVGRIVIRPSWREYAARPDEIVVELDPGMAFGTGLHPTTQMCLQALEKYVRPGMHMLDLGTGSGILSIAAAKLGASSIVAVDVDPVAIEVATANVAANGVQGIVSIALGSVDARTAGNGKQGPSPTPGPAGGRFDLIVENIVADVILSLAVPVANSLAPSGVVIAGGILEPRLNEVTQRLTQLGLSVLETLEDGDWRTIVFRRPSSKGGS